MGQALNDPNMVAQIEYGLTAEEVEAVNQSQQRPLTTNEIAAYKQSKGGMLVEMKRKQMKMSIDEASDEGRESRASRESAGDMPSGGRESRASKESADDVTSGDRDYDMRKEDETQERKAQAGEEQTKDDTKVFT